VIRFGVHLPLISFDGEPYSLDRLTAYADAARRLGYDAVSVNDHFLFPRPWLDGPSALAAVIDRTEGMTLATTVCVPAIRGPIAVAKTLAAIDVLSGGRLVVGVGPGSSARDYEAVGIPFEERWKRLDESVLALRSLWRGDGAFSGRFYSTDGIALEPRPSQAGGPPIWIGSWGSEAGLKRTARLADGWLASAYNTTPPVFATAWRRLQELLPEHRKDASTFPNSLATMWTYIDDDASAVDRVYRDLLCPMLNRPEEELHEKLFVGSVAECRGKLAAYRDAGLQGIYLWPVRDELRQLEVFMERVASAV
jgi:alkanesulfonate monooxygenase SsuD/methylene tetrahydromethanopterin reductase-like flavin-dependent oxidoreductase (luciferase family)